MRLGATVVATVPALLVSGYNGAAMSDSDTAREIAFLAVPVAFAAIRALFFIVLSLDFLASAVHGLQRVTAISGNIRGLSMNKYVIENADEAILPAHNRIDHPRGCYEFCDGKSGRRISA